MCELVSFKLLYKLAYRLDELSFTILNHFFFFFFNFRHPIIKKLYKLKTNNPELGDLLIKQLFSNAMVGAGLADDPRTLLTTMNDLLVKALEKH